MTEPRKAPIKVTAKIVGLEDFRAQLGRISQAPTGDALRTIVQAGAIIIRKAAAEKAPKKTRTLARSIHLEVLESGATHCTIAIGTDVVYAAIHEFGGVILPKQARALAIPVGDLVGSPRMHTGMDALRLARTRSGQAVLVDQMGWVQYILKDRVVIPARPYLRPAWDENIDKAIAMMGRVLQQRISQLEARAVK